MRGIMTGIQTDEKNTVERVIDGTEREVKSQEQSPLHILQSVGCSVQGEYLAFKVSRKRSFTVTEGKH